MTVAHATSVRATAGAVLGTVTDTAAAISNTVNTISGAVNMANQFVQSASLDQKDRQVIHRKTFRDTLLRESRMSVARSNNEVLSFVGESESNAALYKQAEEYLPDDIFG
jgi:hypothetical protein